MLDVRATFWKIATPHKLYNGWLTNFQIWLRQFVKKRWSCNRFVELYAREHTVAKRMLKRSIELCTIVEQSWALNRIQFRQK